MDDLPVTGSEVTIRWARGDEDVAAALELRERVFCEEQGVPREEELDGRDEHALHLVALAPDDGRVVGTLRLLIDAERAKVGRVAVAREWRRHGIAARMLALALEAAPEHGCTRVRLAAQLSATSVYERAGFAVESEQFEEAGIPHVWMGLRLAPPLR
jgi:putative N-acetyltransferase (TIGR04045 family)